MTAQKQKIITFGFAAVAAVSLVAAVLPAIKGQSLNFTFLGVSAFWLLLSVVVGRKADGRAP